MITDEEDVNEDHDQEDYGDEQDMIADGLMADKDLESTYLKR